MHLVGVTAHIPHGSRLYGERHERELQVGKIHTRTAADETARLEVIRCGDPVMPQKPTQAADDFSEAMVVAVNGDRLPEAVVNDNVRMVVEMGTDGRHIAHRPDIQLVQEIRWPHTGKLQNLR